MKYEYKVVPFIGKLKSGESATVAAQQLQTLIAKNTYGGWEFVQLGDVNIEVQPGCIAGFFGGSASYTKFDQIIFRKLAENEA